MSRHLLGVLEPSVVLQINRDAGCPPSVTSDGGEKTRSPCPLANSRAGAVPVQSTSRYLRSKGINANGMGRVRWCDLPNDQKIRQHPHRSELLLHGRFGPWKVLNPGSHMERSSSVTRIRSLSMANCRTSRSVFPARPAVRASRTSTASVLAAHCADRTLKFSSNNRRT
jgi:hypothetical protein